MTELFDKDSQMSIDDFTTIDVDVLSFPKLDTSVEPESGEIQLSLKESSKRKKKLTTILGRNGFPLYPHTQFLYAQLQEGNKNTSSEAYALLSFQRFLHLINKSYTSLTRIPEEGVAWMYADYLLDNLKEVDPTTNEVIKNPDGYSITTARLYMGIVIKFYKWLHTSGLFFITREKRPFEFKEIRLRLDQSIDNNDLLGHVKNKKKAIQVQTTDLMKRFPKVQSTPSHLKLKPMSYEDKDIFITHLKSDEPSSFTDTKGLMLELAIETGLRVEELVSFPESGIHYPTSDSEVIPFTIGPANGCKTKFDKQRTIEIPFSLMLRLHEYLHSDERIELLAKGLKRLKNQHEAKMNAKKEVHFAKGGIEENFKKELFVEEKNEHKRLFINNNGLPYSKQTIQKCMSDIRSLITKKHENWYYRVHDLRSTFATHWLRKHASERNLVFDLLVQELATLMGHESTKETEKYINFMNDRQAKLNFAARKNKVARSALKNSLSLGG